jgi:hypothetical protein
MISNYKQEDRLYCMHKVNLFSRNPDKEKKPKPGPPPPPPKQDDREREK